MTRLLLVGVDVYGGRHYDIGTAAGAVPVASDRLGAIAVLRLVWMSEPSVSWEVQDGCDIVAGMTSQACRLSIATSVGRQVARSMPPKRKTSGASRTSVVRKCAVGRYTHPSS